MSRESRMSAGILLVVLPTVMYGGLSLLMFLTARAPGIVDNPLRHDLWRAGHAHAGVYLVLSLPIEHTFATLTSVSTSPGTRDEREAQGGSRWSRRPCRTRPVA